MAEHSPHAEAAKKDAEALKKTQQEQREKMAKGKPTPTQEENDKAISGEQVKLADDGSGPDPNVPHSKGHEQKK